MILELFGLLNSTDNAEDLVAPNMRNTMRYLHSFSKSTFLSASGQVESTGSYGHAVASFS